MALYVDIWPLGIYRKNSVAAPIGWVAPNGLFPCYLCTKIIDFKLKLGNDTVGLAISVVYPFFWSQRIVLYGYIKQHYSFCKRKKERWENTCLQRHHPLQ